MSVDLITLLHCYLLCVRTTLATDNFSHVPDINVVCIPQSNLTRQNTVLIGGLDPVHAIQFHGVFTISTMCRYVTMGVCAYGECGRRTERKRHDNLFITRTQCTHAHRSSQCGGVHAGPVKGSAKLSINDDKRLRTRSKTKTTTKLMMS